MILGGELPGGTPLSQLELAARLGISRTPLREALRMLQEEGLVISTGSQGRVFVADLNPEDLEAIYAMRVLTEPLGAAVSVRSFAERDLVDLEEILASMRAAADSGDVEAWEDPHLRFHSALVARLGGPLRAEIVRRIDRSERYRRVLLSQEPRAWVLGDSEHVAIIEACRRHDPILAAQLLGRHLARTALTVMNHVAPEHEPTTLRTALRFVLGSSEQVATGNSVPRRG